MGDASDRSAKFAIGEVVHHRFYPFRGVVYDVDATFGNTEEWWLAIPEDKRPAKDQPYYHVLAENEKTTYNAYVSEQNLVPDATGAPCRHPLVKEIFGELHDGRYTLRARTEMRLKDRFVAREFHDFILAQGLLPPDVLNQSVQEEFVAPRLASDG